MVLCLRRGMVWRGATMLVMVALVHTVVFRQPSCATWFRRGLRHRLLIIRGRLKEVGSRPWVADRLAVHGVGDHDPKLLDRGPRWLG
jgi:hypothetical protein